MRFLALFIFVLFSTSTLTGCETTYYAALEKVGLHKRDILVDRVESASASQQEAQQEFQDALTQLSGLIDFDGGDLAQQYELSKSHYDASLSAANDVSDKIAAIESVAEALFDEWQSEIDLYSSRNLKVQSEAKLKTTQRNYQALLKSMYKAESRMAPVLSSLQDNVLFLKHNLNAKAVGSLQGEYVTIKRDVEQLIKDMNSAIELSNSFVTQISD